MQEGDLINWNSFFVGFGFEVNYVAGVMPGFGGTLRATECIAPGRQGDKIGVDTVIVRTVHDYNENHGAGSVVNDIVLVKDWSNPGTDPEDFISLARYIKRNAGGVQSQVFEIRLAEPPSDRVDFALDVTYILNNGEEFGVRTAAIELVE